MLHWLFTRFVGQIKNGDSLSRIGLRKYDRMFTLITGFTVWAEQSSWLPLQRTFYGWIIHEPEVKNTRKALHFYHQLCWCHSHVPKSLSMSASTPITYWLLMWTPQMEVWSGAKILLTLEDSSELRPMCYEQLIVRFKKRLSHESELTPLTAQKIPAVESEYCRHKGK